MIKVSDYIARYLEHRQVGCVFELIGGMITHLIDALHTQTKVRIVSVHHEQAAAFAADAMGRITGIPGVALATSGPGATNLLTGVASCYFDSSPAVFITGQVNRAEMRGQRGVRQLGFQETDIVAMAQAVTKAAWLAQTPEEVPALLDRAFALATSGRPGPVLVDLPMDVQRAMIADTPFSPAPARSSPAAPLDLTQLFADLARARRPLILAGGGVRSARAAEAFAAFADTLGIPVVHSLMGVDLLPHAHPLRVGMIGTYGNRWANLALAEADFVLVLGSRLDVRQTGADTRAFAQGKTFHHVDVDAAEINNRVPHCHSIIALLGDFFSAAAAAAPAKLPTWPAWRRHIAALRQQWPDTAELQGVGGINPNALMHAISAHARDAAAFVTDVGQHQMWAAQSLQLGTGQRFLTSGGMGSMGFGLPAAIGAAVATQQNIVLIAGDGGFQCNIQELQTLVENRLPVRMVILDNKCYGMVRQFQESYFDRRYQSTLWGYSAPDFAALAQAYGIPSRTIDTAAAMDSAAAWLSGQAGPALLHVKVDPAANAYPKIAFGKPISEMEPLAKPNEMEST